MPQDNRRTESQRAENARSESARAERPRSERAATANAPFGESGTQSIKAGLRMQNEMAEVLQDIARGWFERATSKAELAFKLPNKLTAARSVPDALSAYQEWLGEWMNTFNEDSRRFLSDSRRVMDTGARCFTAASPAVTS
jgi:hypothetical protein